MRVLLISVFPPAQIADADHACRIATHLADRGMEVHVLAQEGSVAPSHPRLRLHAWMRRWSWADVPTLIRCVKVSKPDVVLLVFIGHLYKWHPMITFAPNIVKMVCPTARFVTQIENLEGRVKIPGWGSRFLAKTFRTMLGKDAHWQYGTLLRDSECVIVLSGTFLPTLKQVFAGIEAKAVVIPPPSLLQMSPDDEGRTRRQQREALGVRPEDTLLAFLGYFYEGKGLETLVAAFQQVCSRRDDVRLVLIGGNVEASSEAGKGYADNIRDLVNSMGLRQKIHFSGGFAEDDDRPSRYLRAADVAVLPFDIGVQLNNSSFAAVVAHGLPVITTQGSYLEKPFEHGRNVFLCPPKDAEQMVQAIDRVIADAGLRRLLQEGAFQLARDCFSWETATEQMYLAFQGTAGIPGANPIGIRAPVG